MALKHDCVGKDNCIFLIKKHMNNQNSIEQNNEIIVEETLHEPVELHEDPNRMPFHLALQLGMLKHQVYHPKCQGFVEIGRWHIGVEDTCWRQKNVYMQALSINFLGFVTVNAQTSIEGIEKDALALQQYSNGISNVWAEGNELTGECDAKRNIVKQNLNVF